MEMLCGSYETACEVPCDFWDDRASIQIIVFVVLGALAGNFEGNALVGELILHISPVGMLGAGRALDEFAVAQSAQRSRNSSRTSR